MLAGSYLHKARLVRTLLARLIDTSPGDMPLTRR